MAARGWFGLVLCNVSAGAAESGNNAEPRSVRVALVQFDSVPEKTEHNLDEMERLTRKAVEHGARWVAFHEGCLADYTPRVGKSWDYACKGGCVVFDANGKVLAKANRNGEEDILYCTLTSRGVVKIEP